MNLKCGKKLKIIKATLVEFIEWDCLKKTLLTTKDGIVLFKNSTIYSKPIIKIGNLEAASIKKCIPNWCLVEIQKYRGWIQTDHVWGLENKIIN